MPVPLEPPAALEHLEHAHCRFRRGPGHLPYFRARHGQGDAELMVEVEQGRSQAAGAGCPGEKALGLEKVEAPPQDAERLTRQIRTLPKLAEQYLPGDGD